MTKVARSNEATTEILFNIYVMMSDRLIVGAALNSVMFIALITACYLCYEAQHLRGLVQVPRGSRCETSDLKSREGDKARALATHCNDALNDQIVW